MKLSTTILLMLFCSLGFAKTQYTEFKVGCLGPTSTLVKFDCREQIISYEILTTFHNSKREGAKAELEKTIFNRARFFLDQKKYDYFSVISLMSFPVKEKEKWLMEFQKLPGKRAPFTLIALDRVKEGESSYCKKKKVEFYLKEICDLKIFKD